MNESRKALMYDYDALQNKLLQLLFCTAQRFSFSVTGPL